MKKALTASLVAATSLATAAGAHPDDRPRTVLAVLAHPDDELVFAPALAAEARSGSDVRIIFVTSGDAGPGVSDYEPGEALAQARQREALCAGDALNVSVEFLEGHADGTLTQTPRAPDSPAKKLLEDLGPAIGSWKPEIVITWGPDGGYGHGDHRMVSALVTQVLQEQPAEERPELYYPAFIHAPLPPILSGQGWTPTAPDLAEISYAYSEADLAAAQAAALCYETQFDEATRATIARGFHALVWKGEVSFRSAF